MNNYEIELKSFFLDQVSQAISDNEKNFLELKEDPSNTALVDKIFRWTHSLKGGARALGFFQLGLFNHELESVLLKIRNKELVANKIIVNLLLRCNDQMRIFVNRWQKNQTDEVDCKELVDEIRLLSGFEDAVNGGKGAT